MNILAAQNQKRKEIIAVLAYLVVKNNVINYVDQCNVEGVEPDKKTFSDFGTMAETAEAVLGQEFFTEIAEQVAFFQTNDPTIFELVLQEFPETPK